MQVTVSRSSTSSGSSDEDLKHAREKSASPKKEVAVVAKKGCKPAAKKASVPPPQGESEDPPSLKAKRATKWAPNEAKVAAPEARAPPNKAPKKAKEPTPQVVAMATIDEVEGEKEEVAE